MKRLLLFLIAALLLIPAASASAQGNPDAIVGKWLTEGGKSLVQIYKCGNQYCGRIIWLKNPKNADGTEKLDTKNPDASKRSRKLIGMNLIYGFNYDGGANWSGGRIYDPENGKTYKCKMELQGNQLKVRGYIGISAIGRTTVWVKR